MTLVNSLRIGDLFGLSVGNIATLPANSSIGVFILSAVDVIHAVALPSLGVKADAIPGRLVHVKLLSDLQGTFSGQCSELCGAMHAFMPLQVVVFESQLGYSRVYRLALVKKKRKTTMKSAELYLGSWKRTICYSHNQQPGGVEEDNCCSYSLHPGMGRREQL